MGIVTGGQSRETHSLRARSQTAVSTSVRIVHGNTGNRLGHVRMTCQRIVSSSEVRLLSFLVASADIVGIAGSVSRASVGADSLGNSKGSQKYNSSGQLHDDDFILYLLGR